MAHLLLLCCDDLLEHTHDKMQPEIHTRARTRFRTLFLRREAPYQLRHASYCLPSHVALDAVAHPLLLCCDDLLTHTHDKIQPEIHTRGGIRARSRLLGREAPYPLGHTSYCLPSHVALDAVAHPLLLCCDDLLTHTHDKMQPEIHTRGGTRARNRLPRR